VLRDGDQAYPRMLDAIAGARETISFCTYIFYDDPWGNRFVDTLIAAHQRGVEVRVIVDGVGLRNGRPALRRLQKAGVPVKPFLWSWKLWELIRINLRNHRKLLVIDGVHGFTGGLNIRATNVHSEGQGDAHDLHFDVRGPVVQRLQAAFALDWQFTGGDTLDLDRWFPEVPRVGTLHARVVPEGPDEDNNRLTHVLFAAITSATQSVRIASPYFLPDEPLKMALKDAVARGVEVTVIQPATNDPAWFVHPARADAEDLVEAGVRIGLRKGLFEHTKLTVVDDTWVLIGSANWDPRSFRLNFELSMSIWDPTTAKASWAALGIREEDMTWWTAEDLKRRPMRSRLPDRLIWLAKPYL